MTNEQTQALANALKVFLLDRRIRRFLDEHDPKSVEQAKAAILAVCPGEVLDAEPAGCPDARGRFCDPCRDAIKAGDADRREER